MSQPILFVLKPGFHDGDEGPFFCPPCAMIKGFLSFFPELKEKIDIREIEFTRPREEVIKLIGEEHQSCPVLVLPETNDLPDSAKINDETGKAFINNPNEIMKYISSTYGVFAPHF